MLTPVKIARTNNEKKRPLAYLVRPRIEQTGPREYVVAVYVLETGQAHAPREVAFRASVERTATRARNEAERLVTGLVAELRRSPGGEIRADDPQWSELVSRIE